MKKKLILLSLISLMSMTSCNIASLDKDLFFSSNYLEGINLFNMPSLDPTNSRLVNKKHLYYTSTDEEFTKYNQDMFKYLIERESMDYVLFKGEKKSDLLDDKYNRFNVHSSNDIAKYQIENGYQYIFSYDELNEDTSLHSAFEITLTHYATNQQKEEFGTDFTYNSIMSIIIIDNPQYLFYTI